MNTETVTPEKQDSYFELNSPWITPAWATFIIVMAPLLVTVFDVQNPLPGWSIVMMAVIGSLLTGFRSMQVNTFSARLMPIISGAVIIGSLLVLVFR